MDHSTLSHDTQQLIDRKNALLSSFSDSEDRIARKISHLPQNEATLVIIDTPEDPIDQLFDEAVEKAERRQQNDEAFIGYHTEEILGVEEALLALEEEKHFSSPDLAEVESLLNQAEDLINTMPDNRYIAARAAVDKIVLDNNPLKKKKPSKKQNQAAPATQKDSDSSKVTKTPKTAFSETPKVPKTLKENDLLPATSSKIEFLALFISLLTFALFLALLAPVMARLDYLALLILVIFMILTLDMSYQSVLMTSVLLILAYTAGYIREILIGIMQTDLLHLGWFIFIPLCLISASRFIKKAYPKNDFSLSEEEIDDEEELSL